MTDRKSIKNQIINIPLQNREFLDKMRFLGGHIWSKSLICLNYHPNNVMQTVVAWCATRYTNVVIKSFRHKGLKRLYETGKASGVQTTHVSRLRMQLLALDTAQEIDDMDIPGFKLHSLKGKLKGRWSISVSGNWRITFEFREGNAFILDYEDYH